MTKIEQYTQMRARLVELHGDILAGVTNDDMRDVAEEIGILEQNKIVVASEMEEEAVIDYMLYRKTRDGSSKVSKYKNEITTEDDVRNRLMQAMEQSETSLYELIDINKEEKTVTLRDAFDPDKVFTIVDMAMSQTGDENLLLFTRLIHLDNFSMTSGLAFTFRKNHLEFLRKRSRKMMKKMNVSHESDKRFIAFFMLSRREGVPFEFRDVE